MSARDKILQTVAANQPSILPLPEIVLDRPAPSTNLVDDFMAMLTRIGGTPVLVNGMEDVAKDLRIAELAGENVVNTIPGLSDLQLEALAASDATALEPVFKAYVEGTLGVAENGSVWLNESKLFNRLLPFICQHLIIVLDASKIVSDMHEAYRRLDVGKEGYGVFLAGPSKTADIEQSLVIGAHGARSLIVYLVQGNQ